MSNETNFTVNVDKALETIVWLANQRPGLDIYHVAKIIFYADKIHLNRYGRPVVGDRYIKMDNGPVPSIVRDLIHRNSFLSSQVLDQVESALSITGRYRESIPLRKAVLKCFSKSDLECLGESFKENIDKSFAQLRSESHQEPSWIAAEKDRGMDYNLMIDDIDINPMSTDLKEHIQQLSRYIHV